MKKNKKNLEVKAIEMMIKFVQSHPEIRSIYSSDENLDAPLFFAKDNIPVYYFFAQNPNDPRIGDLIAGLNNRIEEKIKYECLLIHLRLAPELTKQLTYLRRKIYSAPPKDNQNYEPKIFGSSQSYE